MKLRQNGTVSSPIKLDVKRPAVVLNLEPISFGLCFIDEDPKLAFVLSFLWH